MVIDASAFLAILLGEPEANRLVDAIVTDAARRVGAPTVVEAAAALMSRKGPQGAVVLDALLQRLSIEIVPMTREGAAFARAAYGRWGKGIGSPAVLNYSDCLAYGVAMAEGEPLLFKGDDFSRTDVAIAPY